MTPIKCVLVDDELPTLAYLQALCRQLPDVDVVKSYNNPLKFLKELDRLDFDACVLDITMPSMDGLQVAKRIIGKAVIFSTAHKVYAADAYDLDAVDYLRKPYQLERLEKAFAKVRSWLAAQQLAPAAYLELNTSRGKTNLNPRDIAYILVAENDRRDKLVMLKSGGHHLVKNITFGQLLDALPSADFCQINRKTIVAIDTVSSYTTKWVYCILPASREVIQPSLSDGFRPALLMRLAR